MASLLVATKAGATVPAKRVETGDFTVTSTYTLTAALVVDDVIQMVKVPAGATVLDVTLTADDIDTGGSPAIVLDVGDGADVDRFIDGSTSGQAGGITRANTKNLPYTYTADDTIDVLVQVAPATGATSGTIKLIVAMTMDP